MSGDRRSSRLLRRGPLLSEPARRASRLSQRFWTDLKEIAAQEGVSVSALVTAIDEDRQHANLSSAIRLFVLEHYRRLADETAQGKGKR
jgi:predicted DNA-binding ribbon-helix-helix protein